MCARKELQGSQGYMLLSQKQNRTVGCSVFRMFDDLPKFLFLTQLSPEFAPRLFSKCAWLIVQCCGESVLKGEREVSAAR